MKVYLGFKISVVSVVSDGIIFHVILNISVVTVVSDKISVVIGVSDGIIFHVVLKISPISVVTGEIIFYVL